MRRRLAKFLPVVLIALAVQILAPTGRMLALTVGVLRAGVPARNQSVNKAIVRCLVVMPCAA
jgi:hypothetical protein